MHFFIIIILPLFLMFVRPIKSYILENVIELIKYILELTKTEP